MSDSELNFVDIFFIRVHYFLKSGLKLKSINLAKQVHKEKSKRLLF